MDCLNRRGKLEGWLGFYGEVAMQDAEGDRAIKRSAKLQKEGSSFPIQTCRLSTYYFVVTTYRDNYRS